MKSEKEESWESFWKVYHWNIANEQLNNFYFIRYEAKREIQIYSSAPELMAVPFCNRQKCIAGGYDSVLQCSVTFWPITPYSNWFWTHIIGATANKKHNTLLVTVMEGEQ